MPELRKTLINDIARELDVRLGDRSRGFERIRRSLKALTVSELTTLRNALAKEA